MKNNNITNSNREEIPTKLKIVNSAVVMFAEKGFTETGVREIAEKVGIKPASLYSHFQTKSSILDYILADYVECIKLMVMKECMVPILRDNPTPDGAVSCLALSFPEGRQEYYLKVLSVILQEQHRNPIIREFVSKQYFLKIEERITAIIEILKELNAIRCDTDPDFWAKASAGILDFFGNLSCSEFSIINATN